MNQISAAGVVPASVIQLYEGVMRAMMMNWWRTAAIWLLGGGMTIAGAVAFAAGGPGTQDTRKAPSVKPAEATAPTPRTQEPPLDLDSPETLRKTNVRRVEASKRRLQAQQAYYDEGRITIDRVIDASLQLMLAETAASTTKEQRLAAAKGHWERMYEVQKREQDELKKGKGTVADTAEAIVAHEDAAVRYLEARQSRPSPDVEALQKRVETLEKQLERVMRRIDSQGSPKP